MPSGLYPSFGPEKAGGCSAVQAIDLSFPVKDGELSEKSEGCRWGYVDVSAIYKQPPGVFNPRGVDQVSVSSEGPVLFPGAHIFRHLGATGSSLAGVVDKIRVLRDCRDHRKYEQRRQHCIYQLSHHRTSLSSPHSGSLVDHCHVIAVPLCRKGMALFPRAHILRHLGATGNGLAGIVDKIGILGDCRVPQI